MQKSVRTPPLLHAISMSRVLSARAASGSNTSPHSRAAFLPHFAQVILRLNRAQRCKWRIWEQRKSSRRCRPMQIFHEVTIAFYRHRLTTPACRSRHPSTSQRCRCPRFSRRRAPRRAPHHPDPTLFFPQELRERALRIVRAGGAAEVITNEKALPETPPNALLLHCLEAVESVADAEWGGQGAGFKNKVLAWLAGSALSPAPPPDAAQAEAKRLAQQAKQVRRDLAAAGDEEKKSQIRSRPYLLFKPPPAPVLAPEAVGGAELGGSDGGSDGGGSGGDDDDEPREPLPRHLGVSRATESACDISEHDAELIGPAGVAFVNAYFAQPAAQRRAEPRWGFERKSFRSRLPLFFKLAAAQVAQLPEREQVFEARAEEVADLKRQLHDERVRSAQLRELFDSLQGRLQPEKASGKRARGS